MFEQTIKSALNMGVIMITNFELNQSRSINLNKKQGNPCICVGNISFTVTDFPVFLELLKKEECNIK